MRGMDWKWRDQDGTPPGEGTVNGELHNGKCIVIQCTRNKINKIDCWIYVMTMTQVLMQILLCYGWNWCSFGIQTVF